MQYEALPNESGGIFLNIGRQDGFVPFQIHSVKLRGPVPEAAMHAPAMTTPPPCFTNEAIRGGVAIGRTGRIPGGLAANLARCPAFIYFLYNLLLLFYIVIVVVFVAYRMY